VRAELSFSLFVISWDIGKAKSVVKTQKLRKAIFQLFAELVDGSPWETAPGSRRELAAI